MLTMEFPWCKSPKEVWAKFPSAGPSAGTLLQSSTDTVGNSERENIQKEFQQLLNGIDQMSDASRIDYIQRGDRQKQIDELHFFIGTKAGKENIVTFDVAAVNADTQKLGIDGVSVEKKEDAINSLSWIDKAIDEVSGIRAEVGALQNRLQAAVNNLESSTLNHDMARSVIEDTDMAQSAMNLAVNSVREGYGVGDVIADDGDAEGGVEAY